MKKICLVLLVFTSFLSIIKADNDILKKDFEVKFGDSNYSREFILNTYEVDDGYLSTVTSISGSTTLLKYNRSGNIVWASDPIDGRDSDVLVTSSNKILVCTDGGIFIYNTNGEKVGTLTQTSIDNIVYPGGRNLFNIKDSIFVIGVNKTISENNSTSKIYLGKLNSDFTSIDSKYIDMDTNSQSEVGAFYSVYSTSKNIYIFARIEGVLSLIKVDEKLNYTVKNIDGSALSENEIIYLNSGAFTVLTSDGTNFYYSTQTGVYKIDTNYKLTRVIDGKSVEVYTDEENQTRTKLIGNQDFTSVVYKNGYFFVGGIYENNYTTEATLYVYDDDYNFVSRINLADYLGVESNDLMLSITKNVYSTSDNGIIVAGMINEYPFAVKFLPYEVKTQTDGNGVVTVLNYPLIGNTVKFRVSPKKGYVLDSIIVIDIEGNSITFSADELTNENEIYTLHHFIMPSNDVVIKATFKKDIINPKTGVTRPITFMLILLIISSIVLLSSGKTALTLNE